MPVEIDDATRSFIASHRVARLATAGPDGQPQVVPICYVLDGDRIYSPLDEKRKAVGVDRLKRVRNIRANPKVSMVIDDYSEDWNKLAYVVISGTAEIIEPEAGSTSHARAVALLREKYVQYRTMAIENRPLISIALTRVTFWSQSG